MAFRNPITSILASGIVGLIQSSQIATELIGKIITGALIRTAAAGSRWELTGTNQTTLTAYTALASEQNAAYLGVFKNATDGWLTLASPNLGNNPSTFSIGHLTLWTFGTSPPTSEVDLQASKGIVGPFTWEIGGVPFVASALTIPNEPWTAPALTNGWVNYGAGYLPAGYRKMADGTVMLRGLVKLGVNSVPIFTLPAGYTPTGLEIFTAWAGPGVARLELDSTGKVNVAGYSATGSNIYVSLSGIRFSYTT